MSNSKEDERDLTDEHVKQLDSAINAIDGLRDAYGSELNKIEKIDQEIAWRRFYFPANNLYLIKYGNGTNTSTVHYVEDSTKRKFDPRVYEEYIDIAVTQGFEKEFIYIDSSNVAHNCSFGEAAAMLNNMVSLTEGDRNKPYVKEGKVDDVVAILSGLYFFQKMNMFREYVTDTEDNSNSYIKAVYDKLVEAWETKIHEVGKYKTLTNLTMKEMREQDLGYYAPQSLAFGVTELMRERLQYESIIEKYRNQIYDILKDLDSLVLQGNYINGIWNIVNSDVDINQTNVAELKDAINESKKKIEEAKEERIFKQEEEVVNKKQRYAIIIVIILLLILIVIVLINIGQLSQVKPLLKKVYEDKLNV